MEYPSHTNRRQARRLLTTLVAICLPVLAATFFSGSFFRAGTLQPGEVLNAASAHAAHNPAQGAQVSGFGVTLTDAGFTPYAATVNAGTTVIWSNNTARIQSVSITGAAAFGSGDMLPGKQFTYVFTTPGTYRYSSADGRYSGAITVADAPEAIVDVSIQGYQFQSANITINAGDTVRWTNLDPDRHTVTADNGAFDSGELNQNGVFQFTFNTPGTYGYYCARHPGMRGTITVNGASATNTPGATGTAQATGTAGATGTGTAQATGTAGTTGTPGATGTGTGTPQAGCTPTGNVAITVNESGFNPASITVAAGTRVTWTNTGSQRHRIRDINHNLFDSDDIYNGQTFSYTFCNGGTFYYEDSRS